MYVNQEDDLKEPSMESCCFCVAAACGETANKCLMMADDLGLLVCRTNIWKKIWTQSKWTQRLAGSHWALLCLTFTCLSFRHSVFFSPLLRTGILTTYNWRLNFSFPWLCGQSWFVESESLTVPALSKPQLCPVVQEKKFNWRDYHIV